VKEGVNFGRGKLGFHDYVRVKGKGMEQTVYKIPTKYLHTPEGGRLLFPQFLDSPL
jgi:hypothetical protein